MASSKWGSGGGSSYNSATEAINKQQLNDLKEKVRGLQDEMKEEVGDKLEKTLPNEWIIIQANQLLKIQDAVHEIQEKYKSKGLKINHPLEESPSGLGYVGAIISDTVFKQTEIGTMKEAIGELERKLPKYVKKSKEEQQGKDTSESNRGGDDNNQKGKSSLRPLVNQGELANAIKDGYKDQATVLSLPEKIPGKSPG